MRRRTRGDSGIAVPLVALSATALLLMVALVVDIGFIRGSTRVEQSVADMAALAGGRGLAQANPSMACTDAIDYLNANAKGMPAIDAKAFCHQDGNDVAETGCTGGSSWQASPTTTSGRYTVTIHYPVSDAEIADPNISGSLLHDKTPCQRIRVIVSASDPSFFGGLAGQRQYTTTRTATAVSTPSKNARIPALWLLDPEGCTALYVAGGANVQVGTSVNAGVVMSDSSATACSSNQTTLDVNGSSSRLKALDGTSKAYIGLFALPPGSTTCNGSKACEQSDVDNGLLFPQPQTLTSRATRAPADWRYNCKTSYPTFPAYRSSSTKITITPCPDTSIRGNYMDQLDNQTNFLISAAAAGTLPSTWKVLSGADCSPTGIVSYDGFHNYLVDCSTYSIGSGTDVSFAGGNILFRGDVKMTGGSLAINSKYTGTGGSYTPADYNDLSNPKTHLTGTCLDPGTSSICLGYSSQEAAVAYFKSGGLNLTGGVFHANHTTVIMGEDATAKVKVTGGSPPWWTSPTEGPFKLLSLWAEGSSGGNTPYQITGGAGMELSGVFFTPEADMSLSGGGNWSNPLSAQFIAYRLKVTGGGDLWLSPDPETAISAPPQVGQLIR